MHIDTSTPVAFSQIGQRVINQDALYPAVGHTSGQSSLFIVCDGIGGTDKGEVASQLLCMSIANYAVSMHNPVFDTVHLQAALDQAYAAYSQYMNQHPLVGRMGSTLALVQLHQHGVTVAHIGDSRIYQFRNGKIIFQSRDHKQVNDMVEAGIITATQALTHPWRNRLSRAVTVSSDNPTGALDRPMADISLLTDIQAGDYFFICTDGVLEHLDNDTLETVLATNMPDQAKIHSLVALCDGRTKDNYSGYLIGIRNVLQTEPKQVSTIS
ncbi:PP2C family serine/threonine-protein phosphatase [Spirosoma sp. SC4-14]|uniref:PP2C family protein-serine/threonine phosphatase n=1 Tax=Spirosoma sp. SC4-14 TaxID=3128900 RepID=UPI0030D3AF73